MHVMLLYNYVCALHHAIVARLLDTFSAGYSPFTSQFHNFTEMQTLLEKLLRETVRQPQQRTQWDHMTGAICTLHFMQVT